MHWHSSGSEADPLCVSAETQSPRAGRAPGHVSSVTCTYAAHVRDQISYGLWEWKGGGGGGGRTGNPLNLFLLSSRMHMLSLAAACGLGSERDSAPVWRACRPTQLEFTCHPLSLPSIACLEICAQKHLSEGRNQ